MPETSCFDASGGRRPYGVLPFGLFGSSRSIVWVPGIKLFPTPHPPSAWLRTPPRFVAASHASVDLSSEAHGAFQTSRIKRLSMGFTCIFTSMDWAAFLKHHNLVHSMSRRGNCHDCAVAESFFNLLKRERIRRKVYRSRDEARRDVFDYIEMFYNPKRKHVRNGMLSPVEFEKRQKT